MASTHTLSSDGVELIARFEGLRLVGYRDAVGVPTIGYGHTGPGAIVGRHITRAQAVAYLRADADIAAGAVNRLVKVALTQDQFDALVSFVFNVGVGAFQSSTLLKQLNRRQYSSAAGEFGRWTKAGGRELPGLVTRRKLEADVFRHGTKAAGAATWLTAHELALVHEYDTLQASRRDPHRRKQLRDSMTAARKRVWHAAQGPGGWDAAHRRPRYRSLAARTR